MIGTFLGAHVTLWLVLLTALIIRAIYDRKYFLLPNQLVFLAGVVTLIDKLLLLAEHLSPIVLLNAVLGALAFGGLFYAIYIVSSGKWIGGGDVKLGYVLGAWLGGILLSFGAIFAASLIGTAIAGVLMAGKKATLASKLPFGPLLIIGFIIMYFFGPYFATHYGVILGIH